MTRIGLFEAKTKFSEICEEVARKGETVVVTRRGKPIVKIEPYAEYPEGCTDVWVVREKEIREHGPLKEELELPSRRRRAFKNPLD